MQRSDFMNRIRTCLFSICFICLLCSVGAAEINWTTTMPEGRYLTRKQYCKRSKINGEWTDWSDWDDTAWIDYPGLVEVETRTLYAASDGIFVIGTLDEITMLKGSGAQMAFSTESAFYWTSTDDSIVSVDQTGYVSAHKVGTATIEAHYAGWGGWYMYTVDVVVIPQGGLELPSDTWMISEQAFDDDNAVTMVDLRDTQVNFIGEKAFANADALRLLLGAGGNISVDNTAFDGCDNITFAVTGLGSLSEFAIENGRPCYCIGNEKPFEFVPVSKIETGDYTFSAGDVKTVSVHVYPYYASNKTLSWSSNAPDIVSVSNDGILTCLNPGIAYITVTSTDGTNIQSTFRVTVNRKVSSIILNYSSITMNLHEDVVLTATVLPSDATDPRIQYIIDDPDILSVYRDGTVRSWEPGTTVIHARARDGSNVEATCTVTVTPYSSIPVYDSIWSSNVQATSAKINASVQLPTGNPSTFGYYLGTSPGALSKQEIESSSGLNYTIENIYYTCTGLSPLTTYYYSFFMVFDGQEIMSQISWFTTAATPSYVSIEGTFKECYINVNQSMLLQYIVSPSNASISWSSSNSDMCSVDQSGNIYPHSKGSVTITATASANGSTSSYSWIINII